MINSTDLAHFTGSENLYFNPLFRVMKYTEGIRYLAHNGCGWLVDAALSHCIPLMKKGEEFVLVTLTKKGQGAELVMDDGNGRVLARQQFQYTDFPLDGIKMYAENGVLMLPSER